MGLGYFPSITSSELASFSTVCGVFAPLPVLLEGCVRGRLGNWDGDKEFWWICRIGMDHKSMLRFFFGEPLLFSLLFKFSNVDFWILVGTLPSQLN
jgi:hypothetical protein